MTRLYAAGNVPLLAEPCALGDAVEDLVKPGTEREPIAAKRCLWCHDEIAGGSGYLDPTTADELTARRDYCTQWCYDRAERKEDQHGLRE